MLIRIFFILHIGLVLGTFASVPGPALSQRLDDSKTSGDNKIHPGDLIEIDELGGFDHDWRGRLDPDGFLNGFTKVADPIFALCRTPQELAETVRIAYSTTLRDPKVIVRILDRSQRPMAIFDGAIRQPMRLQIRRPVRLSELAVIGGGFTDRASGKITILRPPHHNCMVPSESTGVVSVTTSDILAGKEGSDVIVMSGDIVTVGTVEPVFVIGGVNRPGRIDWRPGSTISRLVATAGGVSGRGVKGKVSIFRRIKDGSSSVIEVDLDKVEPGDPSDVAILPLDIVDVPIKGDRRRTSPPVMETPESSRPSQPLPIRIID